MRVLVLISIALLAGCAGFTDRTQVESLAPAPGGKFTFSAQTNTVMTANDDGAAERIRREWMAEALNAAHMCANGFAIESRRFVQAATLFANGGDIVYTGRCL